MVEKSIIIKNKSGLHARPANEFVNAAKQFDSDIAVVKEGVKIDGKSILGVLTLGASKGSKVIISAEGKDEEEAVKKLTDLIESGFGEL